MANFYAQYPAGSSNASVAPNGGPIPGDSTLVAGENPSGDQQPLQTDNSGNLLVSIATEPGAPFDVNLIEVGGVATSLGQKAMAASLPVVIASDQSAIHTIVDSSALPTGAATAANQATEIASLSTISTNTGNTATSVASIDTKTPTVGQKTSAASSPVVIASDQSAVPVSGTVTVTGVSTAANQTNGAQKTQIVDGSGNVIASTTNALNVDVINFPATQPVSGTVTANQGTSPWVNNISQWGGSATSLGQKTSANSVPTVLASDQSAIPVSQSGAWSVTANAGTNLNTSALALDASVTALQVSQGSTTSGEKGPLIQGAVTTAAPTYTTAQTNPLSLTTAGALRVDASGSTQPVSGTVTANAGTGTFATSEIAAASSAVTSVASSATSVSLLASNANRKQAAFFNDSTQILYLKLGTTASLTSYTVQIPANGYYELPNGKIYSGAIDGIWASANGNARITELS